MTTPSSPRLVFFNNTCLQVGINVAMRVKSHLRAARTAAHVGLMLMVAPRSLEHADSARLITAIQGWVHLVTWCQSFTDLAVLQRPRSLGDVHLATSNTSDGGGSRWGGNACRVTVTWASVLAAGERGRSRLQRSCWRCPGAAWGRALCALTLLSSATSATGGSAGRCLGNATHVCARIGHGCTRIRGLGCSSTAARKVLAAHRSLQSVFTASQPTCWFHAMGSIHAYLHRLTPQVTSDHIYIVVNAGCREKDLAHIGAHLKAAQVGVGTRVRHGNSTVLLGR